VRAAKSTGTPEIWRPAAVWMPVVVAGAIVNFVYCARLLRTNKTSAKLKQAGAGTVWALAGTMALVWFAAVLLYGMSVSYLGTLGGAVAWPLYMTLSAAIAALFGLPQFWKDSASLRFQSAGIVILVIAIVVLSRGI